MDTPQGPPHVHTPPTGHPSYAGDGIHVTFIDTDPVAGLAGILSAESVTGLKVVGVIPWLFHGKTAGFIVIGYNKSEDPAAAVVEG